MRIHGPPDSSSILSLFRHSRRFNDRACVDRSQAQTQNVEPDKNSIILQDGTPVKLQVTRSISSADAQEGQEIAFQVVDDVSISGVTVLRHGQPVVGIITAAESRRRMGRAGKLSFTVKSILLADGEKAPVRSLNVSSGESRTHGITALAVSGVPMAAAPFLLLMRGGNTVVAAGTQITAFVDGDMPLQRGRFTAAL